jgi:hypothetical protein
LVKHYYCVQQWFNLPYWACEEPRRRLWEDKSTADFLVDVHQVWKESGWRDKSTGLFPELALKGRASK